MKLFPTRNPSSRAAAHRAMARAALRSESSLSVRLRRYNQHMTKARALEALGRAMHDTRSAVYAAIAAGELVSFKSGKRRLILVKELEAWLNRLAKENNR